jgi:hypothetical protein
MRLMLCLQVKADAGITDVSVKPGYRLYSDGESAGMHIGNLSINKPIPQISSPCPVCNAAVIHAREHMAGYGRSRSGG